MQDKQRELQRQKGKSGRIQKNEGQEDENGERNTSIKVERQLIQREDKKRTHAVLQLESPMRFK